VEDPIAGPSLRCRSTRHRTPARLAVAANMIGGVNDRNTNPQNAWPNESREYGHREAAKGEVKLVVAVALAHCVPVITRLAKALDSGASTSFRAST
jgi:hypothetical protein